MAARRVSDDWAMLAGGSSVFTSEMTHVSECQLSGTTVRDCYCRPLFDCVSCACTFLGAPGCWLLGATLCWVSCSDLMGLVSCSDLLSKLEVESPYTEAVYRVVFDAGNVE